MSTPTESRAHDRVSWVALDGLLQCHDTAHSVHLRDFSRGGGFLQTDLTLTPGTEVRFHGRAGRHSVVAAAVVRWRGVSERHGVLGLGVAWTALPSWVAEGLSA